MVGLEAAETAFIKAASFRAAVCAYARKRALTGKCEGRKSYMERDPALVQAAKELSAQRPRLSLRQISAVLAERGFVMTNGKPYPAMSVSNMLAA